MKFRQSRIVGIVLAVAVLFSLSAFNAAGQTYMFGRADFPVGLGPGRAVVADFNGDGLVDIAVSNPVDKTISILLGKNDGTFGPKTDFAAGQSAISLVVGDFNGDGKIDLAGANSNVNSISVLLGNGDGSFQAATTFPTRNPPWGLVSADFNGDGKLDIATVNSTDVTGSTNNSVSILLGNGDGTFQSFADYPMDGAAFSITSGDFNGDGKLDLAIGNTALVAVSILLGNGDGTFQPPTNYDIGTGSVIATHLIARDFNGDGKLDLAGCGTGKVSVLLGNGDGTFQPHVDYDGIGSDAGWMTADDFNDDGKLDLVVANGNGFGAPLGTNVSILIGKGDGTFQAPVNYDTGAQPFSVTTADVNGDGKIDLIMATDANTAAVLIGKGDGTFGRSSDYTAGAVPMSVATGDFNADGKLDVVSANRGDNTVSVFLGKGDGTFQTAASYAAGPVPRAVAVADLNGDGKEDLVVADPSCAYIFPPCPTTGFVSVLMGNGDGTFQLPVSYAVNGYPVSVAAGDFNGDGKMDVAVANGNVPGTVSVLLGKGDGTFAPPVDFATAQNPQAVVLGDFNGDGYEDLAVASGGFSGVVSVLLGRGDGTFLSHTDYPAQQDPISIAVGDFNKDGKVDLAVVNNSGAISILLGNGNGTFQNQTVYHSNTPSLSALAVSDFNGDGVEDLAVVNDFNNVVTLYLGKGDGTFPKTIDYEYSAVGYSFGIAAADVRANGSTDLVVADFGGGGGNSISVLLNSPIAAIFPGSLSFASLDVGSTSGPQTVKLSNPGGTPLVIDSTVANGDFTETSNCGTTISVGGDCNLNISFAPQAPLTRTGTIVIADNAVNTPQAIFASGVGIGPAVGLLPASVTFVGQFVGSTSAAQSVTLTNTGNALLTISNITVSGDFAETNQCVGTLAVGASCVIQVAFSPTAAGVRNGAITVTDNGPGGQNTLALSGTGIDFSIAAAVESSTNVTVTAGKTATYNLSLSPEGGLRGSISLACTGAPSEATCSVAPTSVTLDGSNSANVTVTVTTTAASVLVLRMPGWPVNRMLKMPAVVWLLAVVLVWVAAQVTLVSKPKSNRIFAMATMVVCVFLLAACGGGGSTVHNPGTPPGTYSILVTGTFGTGATSAQHSVTLKLKVN